MESGELKVRNLNVSLYLEGIEVSFQSISINESEGTTPPSAGITLSYNSGVLRLLPGTVVQVFATQFDVASFTDKDVLIFEGEIVSLNYSRSISGDGVSIQALSLLNRMFRAKITPSDALISTSRRGIDGISSVIITNDGNSSASNVGKHTPTVPALNNNTKSVLNPSKATVTIKGDRTVLGKFTNVDLLYDEMVRAISEKSPAGFGNFTPLIREFNKFFESSDLYYGIMALSYKIATSIFIMPNPGDQLPARMATAVNAFTALLQKQMFDPIATDNKYYTLSQILNTFLSTIGYTMLMPAAPTGVSPFLYLDCNNTDKHIPMRITYMPELVSGPPALCNIFFPEQVASYSYSREMLSEPTRLISSWEYPAPVQNAMKQSWMAPFYVTPYLNIQKSKTAGYTGAVGRLTSGFTLEESYRGINLIEKHVPYVEVLAIFKEKFNKDKKGKQVVVDDDIEANLTDEKLQKSKGDVITREFAIDDFITAKYNNRSVQISTEFNPNRMVGLPGIIFEPGYPSIVGIVSQIQTTIDSQRQASSMIVMRGCRIIFDEDLGSVFNPAPPGEPDRLDQILQAKPLSSYLVNDLTQDGIKTVNELKISQDFYSFETIGEDIYCYLLYGDGAPSRRFDELKKIKHEYQPGSETWLEFKNCSEKSLPTAKVIDASILNYIKSYPNGVIKKVSDRPEYKSEVSNTINTLKNNNVPNEILYMQMLHFAIRELKKDYLSIAKKPLDNITAGNVGSTYINKYIDSVTWRRLVSKEDYLSYIDAFNNIDLFLEDSKDLAFMLSGDVSNGAYTTDDLREKIIKDGALFRDNPCTFSKYGKNNPQFQIDSYTRIKKMKEDEYQRIKSMSKIDWVTKDRLKFADETKSAMWNDFISSLSTDAFKKWRTSSAKSIDGLIEAYEKHLKDVGSPNDSKLQADFVELKHIYNEAQNEYDKMLKQLPIDIKKFEQRIQDIKNNISGNLSADDLLLDTRSIDKSIFRPYHLTRKAHVYYAFLDSYNTKKTNIKFTRG